MAYAIVNGIRLHYDVAGTGDPVLLVAGLSMPGAMWSPQVKALPPEPVYTTAQLADDAAALLRELKIARAHVVGLSMGGTVTQELALRHAPLVRSLTLVSTWATADARFVRVVESWVSLASRARWPS